MVSHRFAKPASEMACGFDSHPFRFMCELSESTINILIGGLLASIFPVINLFLDNSKWRKENKIKYLEKKKEELKKSYEKTLNSLSDSMEKDEFDADLITEFIKIYPENVYSAFRKMVVEKDKKKYKDHYFNIIGEMKKSLSDIDKEIKKEL